MHNRLQKKSYEDLPVLGLPPCILLTLPATFHCVTIPFFVSSFPIFKVCLYSASLKISRYAKMSVHIHGSLCMSDCFL